MGTREPRNWYATGLRFECTRCAQCCRRSDGYVWVDVDEVRRLAEHLRLTLDEFGLRHLRRVGARYALLDGPASDACIFLRDGACSVYAVRPRQCRTFPFWPEHLESAASWRNAGARCEGISNDAPVVDEGEIEDLLDHHAGRRRRATAFSSVDDPR